MKPLQFYLEKYSIYLYFNLFNLDLLLEFREGDGCNYSRPE